ncbi:hypothetical protein HDU97_009268 [Phlyctochytrium planicorne]|nr:hypothetical protein HDU97_009268 [Phlyctochytrium planicorne]
MQLAQQIPYHQQHHQQQQPAPTVTFPSPSPTSHGSSVSSSPSKAADEYGKGVAMSMASNHGVVSSTTHHHQTFISQQQQQFQDTGDSSMMMTMTMRNIGGSKRKSAGGAATGAVGGSGKAKKKKNANQQPQPEPFQNHTSDQQMDLQHPQILVSAASQPSLDVPQGHEQLEPTSHATLAQPSTASLAVTAPSDREEREHQRKVSHSAIERRRRERINDKIMQLKQLVPSCADRENLHKLSILQNAIEYIHKLQAMLGIDSAATTNASDAGAGGVAKIEEDEDGDESGGDVVVGTGKRVDSGNDVQYVTPQLPVLAMAPPTPAALPPQQQQQQQSTFRIQQQTFTPIQPPRKRKSAPLPSTTVKSSSTASTSTSTNASAYTKSSTISTTTPLKRRKVVPSSSTPSQQPVIASAGSSPTSIPSSSFIMKRDHREDESMYAPVPRFPTSQGEWRPPGVQGNGRDGQMIGNGNVGTSGNGSDANGSGAAGSNGLMMLSLSAAAVAAADEKKE